MKSVLVFLSNKFIPSFLFIWLPLYFGTQNRSRRVCNSILMHFQCYFNVSISVLSTSICSDFRNCSFASALQKKHFDAFVWKTYSTVLVQQCMVTWDWNHESFPGFSKHRFFSNVSRPCTFPIDLTVPFSVLQICWLHKTWNS